MLQAELLPQHSKDVHEMMADSDDSDLEEDIFDEDDLALEDFK